ncbi:MAG: hypothetical protein ACLRSW_13230 [Christensenellaceae bacterium]
MESKKIYVERETFEMNEQTYFRISLKEPCKEKDVKVAVIPPDKGGYTVLDIVFGNENKADLFLTPYEMKDEATGKIIKGNTYESDGGRKREVYECKVKPFPIRINAAEYAFAPGVNSNHAGYGL